MLVHTREPMGYMSVDGKRVYGESYCYGRFGPTEISHESYRKHRESLTEAPITSEWLTERFGVAFPEVSFTYEKMHEQVSFDTLIVVARLVGIEYVKGRKKPTKAEKRALRRAIIRAIDSS
jgi:hypothetical protein